jgi:DNA recombination protein RmuC
MDPLFLLLTVAVTLGVGIALGATLARLRARDLEAVASRIVEEQGRAVVRQGQEGVESLLRPVAETLKRFEDKVERTYHQENRDRASLLQSLRQLQEAQSRLHADAESLARALTTDTRVQGAFGEVVLERVLETAGLTRGRDYDLQVTCTDAQGARRRPDAVVYLPGDRALVVDAKCSLTAFVESAGARSDEERDAAVDAHIASLRAHLRGLAARRYHEALPQRTLELVMMLVPNEAAFQVALSRDAGLYEEAFERGVVLCSPCTLLAALHLVAHLWRSDRQDANAHAIALEAGKLLEKLAAFVADLDQLGLRLRQAQQSFEDARGKLATGRGNALGRAAVIAGLGARARPETVRALAVAGGAADEDERVEGSG